MGDCGAEELELLLFETFLTLKLFIGNFSRFFVVFTVILLRQLASFQLQNKSFGSHTSEIDVRWKLFLHR